MQPQVCRGGNRVGTVTSSFGHISGTSSQEVFIKLTDNIEKASLSVGDIVVASSDGGVVVLIVTQVIRIDQYSKPDDLDLEEAVGLLFEPFAKRMPGRYDLLKAIPVLRIRPNGEESRPIPPPPRSEVFIPDQQCFNFITGTDPNNSLRIGTLAGNPSINVYLPYSALEKHVLVVGSTGTGKSWLLGVLAERLAEVGAYHVNIDVMGEYGEVIRALGGVSLRAYVDFLPNLALIPHDYVMEALSGALTSELQRTIVSMALEEYSSKHPHEPLESFIRLVGQKAKEMRASDDTQQYLMTRLPNYLKQIFGGLLNKRPTTPEEVARLLNDYGRINLELTESRGPGRDIAVTGFLHVLKAARERNLLKPQTVVTSIDEAQIFLSNRIDTASKEPLSDILRRGRHYGISLVLLTQNPKNLAEDAMTLPHAFFVFSLPREQLGAIRSYIPENMGLLDVVPGLPTGYALMTGSRAWCKFPLLVKVTAERKTPHAAPTLPLRIVKS